MASVFGEDILIVKSAFQVRPGEEVLPRAGCSARKYRHRLRPVWEAAVDQREAHWLEAGFSCSEDE